tara:strand:- start:221 stop:745 length:525 start_codon:yes stop_codon:yes gene_type:complete
MAAGDKIRAKLDSLILGPIKDKQADIKKLIESIRQGGGQSADVQKAEDFKNQLDELQSGGEQIDSVRSQVQTVLKAADSLRKTATATREASVIGSALNPAAAAISIVQEKLIEKFNEEVEDAKSAIDSVGPALQKLGKNVKGLKKDLDEALRKNKEKQEAKAERDRQLGRGEIN